MSHWQAGFICVLMLALAFLNDARQRENWRRSNGRRSPSDPVAPSEGGK
jgi:hypothetical protein